MMDRITLTIYDVSRLTRLQNRLSLNKPISLKDKEYLVQILTQIPTEETLLSQKVQFDHQLQICIWDMEILEEGIEKWRSVFANLPGWNYAGCCYIVDPDNKTMLSKNVVMVAQFAPTMSHNLDDSKNGYEVWLKDNGTAEFWLPTFDDAKQYPELYHFQGSWKDAYLLLISTLIKGWPMDEFPEELRQFLKK